VSFWVCFDHTQEPPWIVTPTPVGETCREYPIHEAASAIVNRLAPLWRRWFGMSALRLLHHEKGCPEAPWEFTEEEYGAAYNRALGHRQVRMAINDIRAKARQHGLNPDDVVFSKGVWPDSKVCTGPLIGMPRVGDVYRPKDPRRKGSFAVVRIENGVVHGDDGRRVHMSRFKRYVKV
jgi:hypothetical protein